MIGPGRLLLCEEDNNKKMLAGNETMPGILGGSMVMSEDKVEYSNI